MCFQTFQEIFRFSFGLQCNVNTQMFFMLLVSKLEIWIFYFWNQKVHFICIVLSVLPKCFWNICWNWFCEAQTRIGKGFLLKWWLKCHPRVTIGPLRVTISLLGSTLGQLRVTLGHLRVTLGHLRVFIGHLRVTISYFFYKQT